MVLRLPAVRRVSLALAVSAAWLAGTPAASQQDTANAPVPIRMPFVADWKEAMPRLTSLFPSAAREAGITEGRAWVKFRVRMDSTVDTASITVERHSRPEFAGSAKEFVARTRFSPAKVGGRPVTAWIRHEVFFQEPRDDSFSGTGWAGRYEAPVLLDAEGLPGLVETHYPPAPRNAGVPGSVLLSFRVAPDGTVDPDQVEVQLMTDLAFEEPAAAVARALRFRPARRNGTPVEAWVTMPIHFGAVVPGT